MKLVLGISDRILVLHHGELLAEGTPQEVRQNDSVKRVYLGQREH
jgi:branched-chain amino acid transport system ATP-binding protein